MIKTATIKTATKLLRVQRETNKIWGQQVPLAAALEEIAQKRLVLFGEQHAQKAIIEMQH
jgi:hypothetical protein